MIEFPGDLKQSGLSCQIWMSWDVNPLLLSPVFEHWVGETRRDQSRFSRFWDWRDDSKMRRQSKSCIVCSGFDAPRRFLRVWCCENRTAMRQWRILSQIFSDWAWLVLFLLHDSRSEDGQRVEPGSEEEVAMWQGRHRWSQCQARSTSRPTNWFEYLELPISGCMKYSIKRSFNPYK